MTASPSALFTPRDFLGLVYWSSMRRRRLSHDAAGSVSPVSTLILQVIAQAVRGVTGNV